MLPEVQSREKRKWQIALRRYILEGQKCSAYAPFFALDRERFRSWIELQFDGDLSWKNFPSHWQFDHAVPLVYFDFSNSDELRLCWNFTNILIAKTSPETPKMDVISAKRYYKMLYEKTGYILCKHMLEKIDRLEEEQLKNKAHLPDFISQNKTYLNSVAGFTSADFDRLNTDTELSVLLAEKEFLKKFND